MNKEELEILVDKNLSIREISECFKLSHTTIRYYLKKFSLKTKSSWYIKKYDDETIIKHFNESANFSDFLSRLGVKLTGGSFYHYKKRLKSLDLDINSRFGDPKSRGGIKTASAFNERALKKDSRLRRRVLKKSMDLAGIKYKCSFCGIDKWMNIPILLDIHHKDKNCKNNNLSNLEYLCPNCHYIAHYINT